MIRFVAVVALLHLVIPCSVKASEALTGIACRSVHLQFSAPESVAFYNELTVEQSDEGSYFMACGFGRGYFGIQQRGNNRKVVLFSIWDPGSQNDPNATPEDRRVKVLDQGPDVVVQRFGGEGTGGQSLYDYDWKIGETCRFFVTARRQGDRSVFKAYFYVAADKRWQPMATFSTLSNNRLLRGYYSFVEDFRRNKTSTQHVRKATFGNAWIRTTDEKWVSLDKAKFTADGNLATNINAGTAVDRFFLSTGGETQNSGTPLGNVIELPRNEHTPPTDLPKLPGSQ